MKEKIMRQNKIKAFTIGETLTVILIIGFMATILISAATKSQPDKNKMYFKKAYSIAERTIAELVNDESLYPYDRYNVGFMNTSSVIIPGTNIEVEGKYKLCALFMSKLNTIGGFPSTITESVCSFETTDGIVWTIPQIEPQTFINANFATIEIDVNGEEDPNEFTGDNQDRFRIRFSSDGKVYVDQDSNEARYLKSSDVTKNN